MKSLSRILLFFLILTAWRCGASRSVNLHELPNYQTQAPQIVFLDLKVKKGAGDTETVTLDNAILGKGEIRRQLTMATSAVQIRTVAVDSAGRTVETWHVDHPLHREVEVASPGGQMERRKLAVDEGVFSLRFQADPRIQKLVFYRVEAGKKPKVLYTLRLKP
ncbi:hypothetical protein GCM10023189_50330 [Nibrella saemangeumensis]|uniref:Uncharacterized protein n=1 Tax=Nibrella saemangeumensis TaxID=1084526 RepID=A0ABP8NHP5_9BACT